MHLEMDKASRESVKKQQLIDSALMLFKTFGFKKVTIKDICKHAQVSKVTFYKYFVDKEALIAFVLEAYITEGKAQWEHIKSLQVPFANKIERMIDLKLQKSNEVSPAFMQDILDLQIPSVAECINKYRQSQLKDILNFFIQGQKEGALNPEFPPEFFLYLINEVERALKDPQLNSIVPSIHQRLKWLLDTFFFGILNHKPVQEEEEQCF